jgi:hypothetical protein
VESIRYAERSDLPIKSDEKKRVFFERAFSPFDVADAYL